MYTPTDDLQAVRDRLNTLEAENVSLRAANVALQARLDATLNDEQRAELARLADACRAASGAPVDEPEPAPEGETGSLIDRV